MINDAPAQLLQRDGLEQVILAVSQINAHLALEHVAVVEIEGRPPGLHFGGILLLLLLLLPLLIVIFLALRKRWPRLRRRCFRGSGVRPSAAFLRVARGVVAHRRRLRAASTERRCRRVLVFLLVGRRVCRAGPLRVESFEVLLPICLLLVFRGCTIIALIGGVPLIRRGRGIFAFAGVRHLRGRLRRPDRLWCGVCLVLGLHRGFCLLRFGDALCRD